MAPQPPAPQGQRAPVAGPAACWDLPAGGTFIKICGITALADARAAVRAGANAVGFVFAPSPRRVGPAQAAEISAHLHPSVARVGVFVDALVPDVLSAIRQVGLDGVQLQGEEGPGFMAALRAGHPTLFIIKGIRLADPSSLSEDLGRPADAVMVDTKDPRRPEVAQGTLPVSWLAGASLGSRLIVAGGLTPANVAGVVSVVHPWGVDVSAGVEAAPGHKDAVKMGAFVQAVRSVRAG